MRIIDFYGVVPKTHGTKLQPPFAQKAINVDLYGGKLQGLPSSSYAGEVIGVDGNVMHGNIGSLHIAGKLVVGFPEHTFVAPDPQNRLGEHTFLFVRDGKLWRTSPMQILRKCPPVEVGIAAPCVAPTLAVLPNQGCKAEAPPAMCAPNDDPSCEDHFPPRATSYKVTYITACGEESAPSPAAGIVDVAVGDAVALHDPNTMPSNAVARRWYRSVIGSKGEVVWLFVTESASSGFIDAKCQYELGESLITDEHAPPPECILGVAPYGDTTTVVWTNKNLYFSEPMMPHAYKERHIQRVFYNIVAVQGFIDNVESEHTYKLAIFTDGLPYVVYGHLPDNATIREVQDWQPCVSARSVCTAEGLVYYTSPHGIVAFSGSNAKVITADFFTENEWAAMLPHTQRLCFWSGRLWGFHDRGGFQMRTSNSDVDRVEFVTELSDNYDACIAAPDTPMYVAARGDPVQLLKWCDNTSQRMRYTWRARVEVQSGMWRPSSMKVVGEDITAHRKRTSRTLHDHWTQWRATNGASVEAFIAAHPQYKPFYEQLLSKQPSVEVTVYADDEVYYKRRVNHGMPFRLPRIRRAINWDVEISGTTTVTELHMQTSNEDLTQEGGAV